MKVYSLKELVAFARKKSPFYKKLYRRIHPSSFRLSDLPIIEEAQFWKANSFEHNQVITSLKQGILLNTGGTTGAPKLSLYSPEEWRTFGKIMAGKLCKAKLLRRGDHAANMFIYHPLYGSYLFIDNLLRESPVPLVELPIGVERNFDIKAAVSLMKELKSTVVMSTPYVLVSLAYFVKTKKVKGLSLNRFLYGGDIMLESQFRFIKSVFPRAVVSSSGYASSDVGFLGYADATCEMNEYRTDNEFTILEIVDEKTGEVIEDRGIKGRLIATNLTKTLLPVIRYPVGDLAVWREPKGKKFRKLKLVGRQTKKDNKIRVEGKEFDYQDFYDILRKSSYIDHVIGFQVSQEKGNRILMKAAFVGQEKTRAKKEMEGLLRDIIPSAALEFVDFSDLPFDARTYKSIKLVRE